jgi:glutathione S-transferase
LDIWKKALCITEIKFGQIPILEFDGQILTQSFAIGRYLGRKFKLVPEDELLAARSDEVRGSAD